MRKLVGVAVVCVVCACSEQAVAPTVSRPALALAPVGNYTLETFRVPGQDATQAEDINDRGTAVGSSWAGLFPVPIHDQRGWVRTSDGALSLLTPLSGDGETAATAVNKHGRIVGRSIRDGAGRAVFWEAGTPHDIHQSQWVASSALDINDDGAIALFAELSSGVIRAFLWQPDAAGSTTGQVVPLGVPNVSFDYRSVFGVAINAAGAIAGTTRRSVGLQEIRRGFVWTAGRGFQELAPTGPGAENEALGLNDRGQVVGLQEFENSVQMALWSKPRTRPEVLTTDYFVSFGQDVNALENVVGLGVEPTTFRNTPLVWTRGDGARALPIGDFTRGNARAINKSRVAAGDVRDAAGIVHAAIWTPAQPPH